MAISVGIIGLPNVGKSTLFSAITNMQIEIANYPFATIEPNIGVVEVKDNRLDILQKIYKSDKKIYNQLILNDIAGLVKGASKGEGLGNKFLSNVREVDALVHVVRMFEDSEIIHVSGELNPLEDINTINLELILSDIEQIDRWVAKNRKRIDAVGDEKKKLDVILLAKKILEDEKKLNASKWDKEQLEFLKTFSFLTLKPMIFLANLSEEEISDPQTNKHFKTVSEKLAKQNEKLIPISAKIEHEISQLEVEEQEAFLSELKIKESGLDTVSRATFGILGLKTYFTCGPKEIHAWAFKEGTLAPQAAGIIHTDFESGFIKVEVFNYLDLLEVGEINNLKPKGKIRIEGKKYIIKDGDICNFRFNN